MFGMGMPEIILILAIALIVIGPKKLPEMAKSLGRAMGEFKRATSDFRETLEIDNELSQVKKAFDDMNVEKPLATEKPLAEKEAGERPPESEKPLSQKGAEPETASEKGSSNA